METKQQPAVQFDLTDISPRAVILTGIGVLLCLIAIVMTMYLLFSYMRGLKAREQSPASPLSRQISRLPPEPRNPVSPHLDYLTMRDEANWKLHHYHWVDQPHGIVAIPIDRAMDLITQRGIPQSSLPASQFYKPEEGDRLTGFGERREPEP